MHLFNNPERRTWDAKSHANQQKMLRSECDQRHMERLPKFKSPDITLFLLVHEGLDNSAKINMNSISIDVEAFIGKRIIQKFFLFFSIEYCQFGREFGRRYEYKIKNNLLKYTSFFIMIDIRKLGQ